MLGKYFAYLRCPGTHYLRRLISKVMTDGVLGSRNSNIGYLNLLGFFIGTIEASDDSPDVGLVAGILVLWSSI